MNGIDELIKAMGELRQAIEAMQRVIEINSQLIDSIGPGESKEKPMIQTFIRDNQDAPWKPID